MASSDRYRDPFNQVDELRVCGLTDATAAYLIRVALGLSLLTLVTVSLALVLA